MSVVKAVARRALTRVSPRATTALLSVRARRNSHRFVRQRGLQALNDRLLGELGTHVLAGPFAGLQLTPATYAEHLGPYLLGSFEAELHPWLESILSRPLQQVVDIGAKFGYYAVGIARRLPEVPVVAFDTDPWARRALEEMSRANATPHVEVRGYCDAPWLERNLGENALVISDCEGFEFELFCKSTAPALASATLLVELHEWVSPGGSQRIERRFSNSHSVDRVASRDRNPPPLVGTSLTDDDLAVAVDEFRRPQEWVCFVPGGPGHELRS